MDELVCIHGAPAWQEGFVTLTVCIGGASRLVTAIARWGPLPSTRRRLSRVLRSCAWTRMLRLTSLGLEFMTPRATVRTSVPAEMDAVGGAEVAVSPLKGIPWPGGGDVVEPFALNNTGTGGVGGSTGEGLAETDIACRKGHADTLVPAVAAADPPEDGIQAVTDGPSSSPPAPGSPTATKARRVAKARPAHVTSLPLLGPTVNSRSLVLAATTDASLDLTGDVGPIGRFGALPPPGGRGIQVDLKGTMYNTLRSRTNTALVVDMGADAARVVAAFHEVLWMIPQDEDAAANHLSGEEEEDGLADHQMLFSAGRTGGAGKASGGSGSLGTGDGDEGEGEGGKGNGSRGTPRAKRGGGKARKRGRGGGAGASATPRKRAQRNGGGAV